VVYRGTDGEAKARGDLDYTGFEDAVMAQTDPDAFDLGSLLRFESGIVLTVSPEKELKNGDRVTVTAVYDKDAARAAGLRITGSSRTFTVEGLGTGSRTKDDEPHGSAVELDAFDPARWNTENGIEIFYSGISPYGCLEIRNHLPEDDPLSRVGYRFSEEKDVHEGDRITVTAYFTVSDMKDAYYFKEQTAVFTVGPVDHYLMDVSELDTDAIARIRQSAQDRSEESAAGFLEFQDGPDYRGFYNGETVTVDSNEARVSAYAFRGRDGFIEALVVPCCLQVTVQDPDWMEDPRTYHYDLVFLNTVGNIVVRADGSVTADEAELRSKGTPDTEKQLLKDLMTWYTDPAAETFELRS